MRPKKPKPPRKPGKPSRATDAWTATLERPHPAPKLAALIEASVGAQRADRPTTERALGLGALALARFAATRGRTDAERLIEVVLDRWARWADTPSQRDAFLQNALAVVSARGELAKRLVSAIPEDTSVAVRVNLACLHAAAGSLAPLARAVDGALDAGATPAQLGAEPELADALVTPAIARLIAKHAPPVARPASKAALAGAAKAALAELAALKKLVEREGFAKVNPPAPAARIAQAAARSPVGFPEEYQALLAAQDGGVYGPDLAILGTADWLDDTALQQRAREYIEVSARYVAPELLECAPIANLGQPNDWILYAPRGIPDDRDARFLYCLDADWVGTPTLAKALARLVRVLATL